MTTTLHAMGVFDEKHALSLKMVGIYGSPAANYAIQNSDLVIAIGSRFDERATGPLSEYAAEAKLAQMEKRGGFVHFDIDPNEIDKVVEADIALVGDCAMYLKAILNMNDNEYSTGKRTLKRQHAETIIKEKHNWLDQIKIWKETFRLSTKYPTDRKLYAQRVIGEINNQTINKENFLFTTGVGCHQMIACQFIDWQYPRSIISSGSFVLWEWQHHLQ